MTAGGVKVTFCRVLPRRRYDAKGREEFNGAQVRENQPGVPSRPGVFAVKQNHWENLFQEFFYMH
jgi:hypothetical protein